MDLPRVRYPFSVQMLRARDESSRLTDQADLGWGSYAAAVNISWVDGRHETMLEPAHARGVADVIAGALA
jgi:thioesterase domain-containing protein